MHEHNFFQIFVFFYIRSRVGAIEHKWKNYRFLQIKNKNVQQENYSFTFIKSMAM